MESGPAMVQDPLTLNFRLNMEVEREEDGFSWPGQQSPQGHGGVQKSQTLPRSSHGAGACLHITLTGAALARAPSSARHSLMGREI